MYGLCSSVVGFLPNISDEVGRRDAFSGCATVAATLAREGASSGISGKRPPGAAAVVARWPPAVCPSIVPPPSPPAITRSALLASQLRPNRTASAYWPSRSRSRVLTTEAEAGLLPVWHEILNREGEKACHSGSYLGRQILPASLLHEKQHQSRCGRGKGSRTDFGRGCPVRCRRRRLGCRLHFSYHSYHSYLLWVFGLTLFNAEATKHIERNAGGSKQRIDTEPCSNSGLIVKHLPPAVQALANARAACGASGLSGLVSLNPGKNTKCT